MPVFSSPTEALGTATGLDEYKSPLDRRRAAHLLRRTSYLGTATDISAIVGRQAGELIDEMILSARVEPIPREPDWKDRVPPPRSAPSSVRQQYNRDNDDSQRGIVVPTQTMRVAPTKELGKAQAGALGRVLTETMSFAPIENELHLALQWDQYAMTETGENDEVGPLLRTHTELVDSLEALLADEMRLEMSDLLPLTSDTKEGAFADRATPYPFNLLTEGRQLALSFDIYHLTYGADDRTRYQVRFVVRRGTKKDGLFVPLGGRESGTSLAFIRSGESRTAIEMIQVDLSDYSGRGQLEITVEVTDQLDGRTISRKIDFELRR